MQLNLKNPIIFLDLETTGIDISRDRIVEISLVKILPGGGREVKTRRVNPEMPIPPEASAIHGIYDDDVKDEPVFRSLARSLAAYMEGCDLGGYNSNRFDIPMLVEEFLRAGVDVDFKRRKFVDVQNIFHLKERRTLEAAYRFYCDKELENAHSAEADVIATCEVLEAQLDRYPDLQNDVAFLADFSARDNCADYAGRIKYNAAGVEVFAFGKHKDRPVEEVFKREPSYYSWMMDGDFPAYTKKVITEIRLRSAGGITKN